MILHNHSVDNNTRGTNGENRKRIGHFLDIAKKWCPYLGFVFSRQKNLQMVVEIKRPPAPPMNLFLQKNGGRREIADIKRVFEKHH